MTAPLPISDDDLALSASRGDNESFAALYERHFRGVYDFSARMVRDQDAALDVVQNTFLSAWQNLQKRTVSGNVKAWLYTIARNTAIDELRRNKRLYATTFSESERRNALPFDRIDTSRVSDPQLVLQDQYLVDLVWNSAAALSPKEYSLLDMHLRKDLAPDEIATSLGVSRGTIHTQLSRLRDSLEESVVATLLMRRGRQECPDLDAILSERQFAGLDRDDRRAVTRHASECAFCQASRKRYIAPAEIFAGLALVPIDDEVRAALWLQISGGVAVGGAAVGLVGAAVGKVAGWWTGSSGPAKGAAFGTGGIAAAMLVGLMLFLVTSGGGEEAVETPPLAVSRDIPLALPGSQPPAENQTAIATLAPSPTPAAAEVVASPAPAPAATPAPATPTPTPYVLPSTTPALPIVAIVDIRIPLNLTSRLVLKTTIFGTETFAVANIDVDSLTLKGVPAYWFEVRDSDSDGDSDLVLQFRPDSNPDGALVCIEGRTLTGQTILGCDSARLVPSS